MKEIVFTRKELYELVWSEPVTHLAEKYHISDNGIRKQCVKKDISLPPVGYWQKIKYGYKPTKTKLSNKKYKENETITIHEGYEKNNKLPDKQYFLNAIKEAKRLNFVVPEKMSHMDILIRQTKSSFKRDYSYEGIYRSVEGVPMRVSKNLMGRALRFMDTIIKLLRARGHQLIKEYHHHYIVIFGIKIDYRIREKLRIEYNVSNYRELHPTGILMFTVQVDSTNKVWKDGKKMLEEQLDTILNYLELKAQ
ncbi:MAG: hypothetical protein JEZ14_08170 [Marinilabiliaceae bacterium]|nr:hypothetical protein [Marinilabiliaceae bacterium]